MNIKSIYNKTPFLLSSICLWGGFYLVVKYWQINNWVSFLGLICFCYGLLPKIRAISTFANHSDKAKKYLFGIIITYLVIAGILAYTFW